MDGTPVDAGPRAARTFGAWAARDTHVRPRVLAPWGSFDRGLAKSVNGGRRPPTGLRGQRRRGRSPSALPSARRAELDRHPQAASRPQHSGRNSRRSGRKALFHVKHPVMATRSGRRPQSARSPPPRPPAGPPASVTHTCNNAGDSEPEYRCGGSPAPSPVPASTSTRRGRDGALRWPPKPARNRFHVKPCRADGRRCTRPGGETVGRVATLPSRGCRTRAYRSRPRPGRDSLAQAGRITT